MCWKLAYFQEVWVWPHQKQVPPNEDTGWRWWHGVESIGRLWLNQDGANYIVNWSDGL
jgi:hypothetical protein